MNTKNAVVQVEYQLSDAYREKTLVETGEVLERVQRVEIDLASATPEQRKAILAIAGVDLSPIEVGRWENWSNDAKPFLKELPLDAPIQTVEVLAAHCERMAAEKKRAQEVYDAHVREELTSELNQTLAKLREALEKGENRGNLYLWTAYNKSSEAKRLGIDRSEYDKLHAEYEALQERIRAANEAEAKARRETEENRKAKRKQERLDWIAKHGSEYLREAVAAGHDCSRRYWIERAALEYPGFTLDANKSADWKSRSCPSEDALAERKALAKAHPDAKVEVVWLTSEPSSDVPEGGNWIEPTREREAIVVDDPRYPYYLVK